MMPPSADTATAAKPPRVRLHEIDGLRGWASLSVMLSHILYGVFWHAATGLQSPFVTPFVAPLLNGTLDVDVFFVLSGDALAAAYWMNRAPHSAVKLAVKRYVRLTVPVLASCLLVFVLIHAGLTFNQRAGAVVDSGDWLGNFLRTHWGISETLDYALFGVYFRHTAETSLNPFLGTMQIELLGSLLVFCYILMDPYLRRKWIGLMAIFLVCVGGHSSLAGFPIGILFGYLRVGGLFTRLRQRPDVQIATMVLALVAIVAGFYGDRLKTDWSPASIIAACVLVFCVYSNANLTAFCSSSLSRWLGKISFPLFLVHFPVIASFTSGMLLLAHTGEPLGTGTIWLIALASAMLSLGVAVLFLPVEKLTAKLGDAVCRAVMRPEFLAQHRSPESARARV
jgi:peptidoglycan/LPS O-acetylase OafA/YrhL